MSEKKMLAIDLGASGGKGFIGKYDGEKITLDEIHRFSNDPVMMPGGFFWDTLRLLHEIKTAILKASHAGGIDTIGIDTWGVDYGYLDKSGTLLSNPYHYRDTRTDGIQPYVFEKFAPKSEIYGITGIQSMNFNSLYENYKTYRKYNVIGVFNEGYGGNYSGDFNELRAYLISELMWNTDLPREEYDRAIYEFIDAYYGAASDAVYEYFTYLTNISGESHFELYASPEAVVDDGIFTVTMQEIANWFNLASKLEADEPEVIAKHLNRLREGFIFLYRHFN